MYREHEPMQIVTNCPSSMIVHSEGSNIRRQEGGLIGENHQPRVQHDWIEKMASRTDDEGKDEGPGSLLNSPFGRYEVGGENDDSDDTQGRDDQREPEALEDLGDFHPEVGTLDFLLRRTPSDIEREKVGKDGLGDVDGQSTEEDEEERNPSKVLEESTQEVPKPEAVLQEGECNVTSGREHNHAGKPDFETMEIPSFDIDREPEQEVVEQGQGCTSSNTIIGEHVGHHVDFVVHRGLRPQENAQLLRDRAQSPPVNNGVEDQFVTPVCVFLPSVQLIITGQTDTLLEAALRVGRPPDNVVLELKTECHVEVFRYM